jgi:hypothetical protein
MKNIIFKKIKLKELALSLFLIIYGYKSITDEVVMGAGGGIWVSGTRAVIVGLFSLTGGVLYILYTLCSNINVFSCSRYSPLLLSLSKMSVLIVACILLYRFFYG